MLMEICGNVNVIIIYFLIYFLQLREFKKPR